MPVTIVAGDSYGGPYSPGGFAPRMQIGNKLIQVVGDRVLIKPAQDDDRTKVGLYLPATVVEKQPVQTGRIVETGPGIAIPNFTHDTSEPWQQRTAPPVKFMPLQAEVGDFVLFLRKEAFEITYNDEEYLVVPHQAILLLVRDAETAL